MAKVFSNENTTPERKICLLLLEAIDVNLYLCQGMIWKNLIIHFYF